MADRRRAFEFPKFQDADPRSRRPWHDSFNNEYHKYVVSASKELVALLNALTCKQCEQKQDRKETFSAKDPPYIAICGHYVHKDCRYVNRDTKNGQWFSCIMCCTRDPVVLGPRPSDSAVFEDFYKKVKEGGFPCSDCTPGENMHPRYNVVQITHDRDSTLKYLCVWCYVNSEASVCGKVLGPEDPIETKPPVSGSTSWKLNSVDSTLHCNQFINFQCCCCMKPLIPWLHEPAELENEFYTHVPGNGLEHLKCGHIRHKDCKLQFKGTQLPEDQLTRVCCHLCPTDCTAEEAGEKFIPSHLTKYSEGKIGYSAFHCLWCNRFHPTNNVAHRTNETNAHRKCVWCKAEQVMDSRERIFDKLMSRSTKGTKDSRACIIS